MPIYIYQCPQGHRQERFLTVANHGPIQMCPCGQLAEQIITAPLMVKCAQDICYDSPIDGRPITSWDARREDLARNNCQEYDPEMKTDAANRRKAEDAAMDASIERTVEESVQKMTGAQRTQLASEVLDQGYDLAYSRGPGA